MSYRVHLKPILDFFMVVMLLIPAVGLGLIIVLAYALTFQFPICFTQPRLGINGKEFKMYKFRTLSADLSKSVQMRKFVLGNMMRASNLDELPQFWNVLKGEMSLIGPRPLPVEYLSLFSGEQKKRFKVKPGITGWAQVNGRHSIPWEQKLELDNYYVDRVSLTLDIRIMIKTLVLFLSFKKDRSLEEEKFKGTH